MKKQNIQFFFLGIVIAFSIAVVIMTAVVAIAFDDKAVPVTFIAQLFILSVLCSLINLVYQSERLKFIWQSLIGYILTTGTLIACELIFKWYSYCGTSFRMTSFVLMSFVLFSISYLVTWLIIWSIYKAKKRDLNNKLEQYKHKE